MAILRPCQCIDEGWSRSLTKRISDSTPCGNRNTGPGIELLNAITLVDAACLGSKRCSVSLAVSRQALEFDVAHADRLLKRLPSAQTADSLIKCLRFNRCTYFQDSSDLRLEGAAQNPVNLSRVYQRQSLRGVGLPIGAGKRVATSPRSCIKRLEGGKGVVIRSERSLRIRTSWLSRALLWACLYLIRWGKFPLYTRSNSRCRRSSRWLDHGNRYSHHQFAARTDLLP